MNNFGQAFNNVIPVPALRAGVTAVCSDDVGAASESKKRSKRKKEKK